MSAQFIIDHALLGSVVRFSDGQPRPPERFTRKLQAWKRNNGTGVLVEKVTPRRRGVLDFPAQFGIHLGDYGSDGVPVISVLYIFSAGSLLRLEVVKPAPPGSVLIVTAFEERRELERMSGSAPEAIAWAAARPHGRYVLEQVEPDGSTTILASSAEAAA